MEHKNTNLFTNNYGAYVVNSDGATVLHNVFNGEDMALTLKTAKSIDAELLLNAACIEGVGAAVLCSPRDAIVATSIGAEGILSFPHKSNAKNVAAINTVLISDNACGIIGVGVLAIGENLDAAMDNASAFNDKCSEYITNKIDSATPQELADIIKNAYENKKESEGDVTNDSAEGDGNE